MKLKKNEETSLDRRVVKIPQQVALMQTAKTKVLNHERNIFLKLNYTWLKSHNANAYKTVEVRKKYFRKLKY